jgi:ATP-binding cassette subfamily B protein
MTLGDRIDAFAPADGPPPRRLGRFFLWALRGALPMLGLAFAISALAGIAEVITALLLGHVIDRALDAGPAVFFADSWPMLLGVAAFFMLLRPALFGLSAAANAIMVGPNVSPLVLSRLHRWTMGQDVAFFDNDFAGRIAQKQMQTARAVTDVVTEIINVVAFALASVIASGLLMITINGWVALGLGLWLMAYAGLIRFYLPRIRAASANRAGARANVSGQIVDTITNIKTVKLFAHADHEDREALTAMGSYRGKALVFGRLAAGFRFWLMSLAGVLPVLLVGAVLYLWSRGLASPGDIATAGAVSIRIAQMSGWVSFTLMTIYSNVGEVENGMVTLTPAHGITDAPDAVACSGPADIEFDNVTFTYGRGSGGIDTICLKVREGEKLGLVGASGAGKSTLVALLLRLYDVEAGQVLIGGQDIRGVTQASLRRRIGMVTQETAMFNRSARDNILYGRPDASEAALIAAARRARAHGFIQDLEDYRGRRGYDAHLGERGVRLSGGQRQRIALARAILKDAPILVLDEATAALDSEVEAEIQEGLAEVMSGKTVIAIAHRLSTLKAMDRIVVLAAGRIVEEGTHAELLARQGGYAAFWARQSGGFIGAEAAE